MSDFEVNGTTLAASYAALIAVNYGAGKGLLGGKTNRELSAAYPTEVTPRGLTFAIWGPIFLLEGGGTALMASSSAASPYLAAAAMPWLATWACQSVWQAAYSTVPVPQESASKGRRALTLVPCAALLCGGHAAMMAAAGALRRDAGGARSLLGALLVDLPTGLNAGWMAAASGIGLTLAAQTGPKIVQSLATPTGGAALIYGLSSYGAAAAVAFAAPHSLLVSLGYSAATAWACDGISKKENVASRVKSAARHGFWISVAGAIVSLGVAFAKSKK